MTVSLHVEFVACHLEETDMKQHVQKCLFLPNHSLWFNVTIFEKRNVGRTNMTLKTPTQPSHVMLIHSVKLIEEATSE